AAGVKAVRLRSGDSLVGMVIASPDMTLLTACANGYGKRTPIGPNGEAEKEQTPLDSEQNEPEDTDTALPEGVTESISGSEPADEPDDEKTSMRYTTKRRGGLGLKDIKTTSRNGLVIGIARVRDDDEVMMITAKGQIQRIAVSDVRIMGRNTQGVRLMNLDEGDTLVAVKRIPKDAENEEEQAEV
ncbi:MAG: DNA gyrase subunit A, partial [Planctomycetaceae bacterium]|nr:DNA gyrase subunit A [Planctomycetaceae bacterium]